MKKFTQVDFLSSLALGIGWGPAMIETEGELAFIREAQKGFTDLSDYWIGGFTDQPRGAINYSTYYTIGTGNHIQFCFWIYDTIVILRCIYFLQ